MKKTTITITTLGLLAILSCWLVIHLSCKKEDDCGCVMTQDEQTFIPKTYNIAGTETFFKNNITNIIDTLLLTNLDSYQSTCSSPCENGPYSAEANFTFSHLWQGFIVVRHGTTPAFAIVSSWLKGEYTFDLNGSYISTTVNGITYNDIWAVQNPDSATIRTNGDQLKAPWKIYYSKSIGFVSFYMLNGQIWSKH